MHRKLRGGEKVRREEERESVREGSGEIEDVEGG